MRNLGDLAHAHRTVWPLTWG